MADIFQEVDEEVRRERLQKLWDRYGNYLIALCVLIVAGVGAWRGYDWWQMRQAAQSGAAFEAAAKLAGSGKDQEADAAFAKLAMDGTAGYRILARLREAATLAKTDTKSAVGAYDALAADASAGQAIQDLAAVRAGYLLVDTAPYAELRSRLEPLPAAPRPFHHSAREILALSAWRSGDSAAARQWIDMMMADPQTPPSTKSRVDVLHELLAAGNG